MGGSADEEIKSQFQHGKGQQNILQPLISPTNAAGGLMNLSRLQNSTLNLNNVSTNQDEGGLAGIEMVS